MVFTTVELLEPILLYLDMRSLLTSALRVCRQWRDLIQGSLLLQRALFFECDEKLAENHGVKFNPLLAELFPILFDCSGTPDTRGFNDLAIEALPIGRRRVAFYRRDATWRRMHMRQPTVKHVGLWRLCAVMGRKEKMEMIKYDEGLRMEGFYFLVLKHVYWWDLYVRWGETQGRQLRHHRHARGQMKAPAEELMRTADVTIGAWADWSCVKEGKDRRSVDGSGLVKMKMGHAVAEHDRIDEGNAREHVESNALVNMGIFWFKFMGKYDGEYIWESRDGQCEWIDIGFPEEYPII